MQSTKLNLKYFLVVFLFTARLFSQSNQQFYELGDFELTSKQIINNCKIGFRTFGKLNSEKSNAILYPTWFGGTSEHLSKLVGEGKLIDTINFFVIATDALGNGISSSPSNNLNEKNLFPEFTIQDMVKTQYLLITKHLNINHLYAVVGGSMGAMQTFEWLVSFPDFITKAIPYVGTPFLTSYELLFMNKQIQFIELAKKNNISDKTIKKFLDIDLELIARTPDYIVQNKDRKEFKKYLASFDKELSSTWTVDNYLGQLKAMVSHDITKRFDGKLENAAKEIKAKLFILVSSRDCILNSKASIDLAKILNADLLVLDNNCGHLGVNCELQKCSLEFKKFLMSE